ncbi:MAG: hypothetical protein ACI9NQ_000848 [Paracoccaceae bacterium]|jgi:hypothetical protein
MKICHAQMTNFDCLMFGIGTGKSRWDSSFLVGGDDKNFGAF